MRTEPSHFPCHFTGTNRLFSLTAALLLATGSLGGCIGDPGADGQAGGAGPDGQQGTQGPQGDRGPAADLPADSTTWDKLVYGIGGQAALDGLTGMTIESSGVRSISGEGFRPGDSPATVDQFDLTTHVDLAGDAMRIDWNRNLLFFGLPLTYSEIVNGNLGYVEGDDHAFGTAVSTTDMPSARWAAVRKQTMLLNPHLLLAMVNADPSVGSEGGVALHDGVIHELFVIQDDIHPITLYVNATNGRIAKLSTMENDHLHRDVPIDVVYGDWMSDAPGNVEVPMSLYLLVDGQVWHEEYRTAVTINPAFSTEFDFPVGADPTYDAAAADWGARSHQFLQSFKSLGLPQNVEQLAVVPTELEPGVFFLGGSSHNSMAIELASSVIIVEPPLYPERSEAILAWVEATFAKPVSQVVITHHHTDHAAGFRAFVAAGAQLVVHENAAGYYPELASRPSTIVADEQSLNPQPVDVVPVPDYPPHIIDSSGAPYPDIIAALTVSNSHAEDMVYVYVGTATQDYVFQSDFFNPDPAGTGSGLSPEAAREFYDGLVRYSLVNPSLVLVGGHGGYAPLQQLIDYVNPAP